MLGKPPRVAIMGACDKCTGSDLRLRTQPHIQVPQDTPRALGKVSCRGPLRALQDKMWSDHASFPIACLDWAPPLLQPRVPLYCTSARLLEHGMQHSVRLLGQRVGKHCVDPRLGLL